MNKINVLLCNEYSQLTSGYSVYGKHLMERLHSHPQLNVAELAGILHDGQQINVPWTVFPVRPNPNDKAATEEFDSNVNNHYGANRFESTCLKFKPNVVLDIRDHWMLSFQETSPFRKYYSWVIMPTVDATPQHQEWIHTFMNADGVFTYTDWGQEELKRHSTINLLGSAPPCAEDCFRPMNKKLVRASLGIQDDINIIGTVMRNQKRKLYPDLFAAFAKFLSLYDGPRTYLYCHTSYPDGWDIPALLIEHGLMSKVLFTYICRECGHYTARFFSGAFTKCDKCRNHTSTLHQLNNGISAESLAKIYNTFDVYVQYSTNEGFGIPMVEAASCGLNVMAIDYSAMTDVVRKIGGIPLKPLSYSKECESGRLHAVPDNELLTSELLKYFALPYEIRINKGMRSEMLCRENYNWNVTTGKWIDAILQYGQEYKWDQPVSLWQPPSFNLHREKSNSDYATWLITDVLGQKNMINSSLHIKLIRDLNNQMKRTSWSDYANEHSYFSKVKFRPFGRKDAYEEIVKMRNWHNHWEQKRAGK